VKDKRQQLVSVTLPEGVTAIERNAFSHCRSLKTVTLPQSIVHIGDLAFKGCDRLTLYAPRTSYAYRYAEEQGIPVRATEDA
jgi:hypothetical protein